LFKDFSDSVLFRGPLSGEYQDQVPTPIPENKPMRALWISLTLCLIPGMSRADVVVYEQNSFDSAIVMDNVSDSYGQAFTNTAGNVAVKSVTFYFAQTAGTTTGNLSVSIWAATGGPGSYRPTGTNALVTSQTKAFATGVNTFNFVSSTTLSNSTYVAVLDLGSLNLDASNTFGVEINPFSGSSQYATSNGVYNNDTSPGWIAQTYQIRGSVVMVPEPGTLLLGGIAAACGGGGVWWRRRRQQTKQPTATETAG
jgi:hypothetical protein